MARAITVEFLGNARDLTQAVDQAEGKMKRFGGVMGKVGKAAAFGLAGGAVIAGGALVKMTQGAIEDEAAQKRLALALKNNTGATDEQVSAVEDWISAQGEAFGVADDDLRPALEKLTAATHDVGEAQKLTKLAMDISAGSGQSLEAVTKALVKAQNGQTAGLAKLGIKTKDSTKDTAAYEAAQHKLGEVQEKYNAVVKEHGKNSDEAKDALYDLELAQRKVGEAQGKLKTTTIDFDEAQKRLNKTYGGQAQEAAETTAGKMQRLKLIMAEAGETIGSKLIPIVTKMADWFLNKGLPAIQMLGAYLQDKLPPIFNRVKTVVVETFNKIKGPAAQTFNDIKSIVKDFVSIVSSLWKRFGATISNYAKNSFKNAITVIRGAFNIIKGIFKVVSSILKGDWKGAWDGIKSIVKGAGQVLKGLVSQLLNILKTSFRLAWSAIKGIVGGAWDGIKDLVVKGFDKVINFIRGVPSRIKDLGGKFLNAGKDLIGEFISGIGNAGSFAADFASDIWNAVKGAINSGIDSLNALLEFDFKVKGIGFTVNAPDIPHLAKGGVVRKPTLALIGEDGPEAVVPLGKKNAPGGGMPFGGGNVYITVQGALDPVGVAKQIEAILMKGQRSMTGPYQFRTV